MEEYLAERSGNRGYSATAQRFFEMSKDWYRGRMDIAWDPPDAGQAMDIWSRHGFTGPFWEV